MTDANLLGVSLAVIIVAQIAMALLMIAAMIAFVRILKGPGLTDRIIALDFLTFVVVGLIGTLAIFKSYARIVDVAIVLALVAFLATVAYARYLERIRAKSNYARLQQEWENE